MQSSRPRKQRRFRFNAPMHIRQRYANVHISRELKSKLAIKRRSVQIRRGDTVKVMIGKNRGKSGKVNRVDLKKSRVFIDGIVRRDAKGKEMLTPISPSNLYITDLDLTDKQRKAKLGLTS